MIRCFICYKGPTDDSPTTVFRVNEVGQKGVWACRKHIDETDATIDPEVLEITGVLEGGIPFHYSSRPTQ